MTLNGKLRASGYTLKEKLRIARLDRAVGGTPMKSEGVCGMRASGFDRDDPERGPLDSSYTG